MRRPFAVKLLSLGLLLVAFVALAGVVVLFRESGSQRVLAEGEAAKIVLTLRITAGVLFFFGLIEAYLALALWRGSQVAWWMSLMVNAFLALLFVYELLDSISVDREDYILAVIPAAIVGLHFLSGVRPWVKQGRVIAAPSNL